jgi:hypothetical protein
MQRFDALDISKVCIWFEAVLDLRWCVNCDESELAINFSCVCCFSLSEVCCFHSDIYLHRYIAVIIYGSCRCKSVQIDVDK